jgi:hypothetical protein
MYSHDRSFVFCLGFHSSGHSVILARPGQLRIPSLLLCMPREESPELALAAGFLALACPLFIEHSGSAGGTTRPHRVQIPLKRVLMHALHRWTPRAFGFQLSVPVMNPISTTASMIIYNIGDSVSFGQPHTTRFPSFLHPASTQRRVERPTLVFSLPRTWVSEDAACWRSYNLMSRTRCKGPIPSTDSSRLVDPQTHSIPVAI